MPAAAPAPAGVSAFTLPPAHADSLSGEGYTIFRGAIPEDWIVRLRESFEACVLPSDRWPVPRDPDWRHAMLDGDDLARSVCLLPAMLAGAFHILKGRFFLSQVQGRDPRRNGGAQALHRDGQENAPPLIASALAFLDSFGPANGATSLVPRSHRSAARSGMQCEAHPRAIVVEGEAGDILLFDANLLHAGTRNVSGAPRRSLLINYFRHELYADHLRTCALRGVSAEDRQMFGENGQDVTEC